MYYTATPHFLLSGITICQVQNVWEHDSSGRETFTLLVVFSRRNSLRMAVLSTQPWAIMIDRSRFLSEMGSVEGESHQAATDKAGNGDGHQPRKTQEADTLPVDGLVGAVAQTDADGGAGDAHGGRDGEGVLGEDENGDGGAHLHGRTTAGRVVGDLVAHDYTRR